jgi:hypothetical protein
MKIHQLPLGARFEYEGEEYVKTGPLFATGPAGQRLIPKYAMLRPLQDAAAVSAPPRRELLPRSELVAAFASFQSRCESLVPTDRRAELDAACREFLQALDG